MKRFLSLLLCILMLALAACSTEPPIDTDEPTEAPSLSSDGEGSAESTDVGTDASTEADEPEGGLIYQAHRGYSAKYPENTVLAINEAIRAGFKICEIDPSFTSDGRCVLMHDTTVNRTCRREDGSSVEGKVSSFTFAELRALDAGLFKGEEFRGTRVPLLIEAVLAARTVGITLKIDNKIQKFSAAEQEIIFMIAEQYPETVGITCKDIDFAKKVASRLPNAIIHYDGTVSEDICRELRALAGENTLYIWYPVASADAAVCDMIKSYGTLGLWTVKNEAELQKALSLGADVIETNGEVKPE